MAEIPPFMDLLEKNCEENRMENSATSNEDVLVVLQTETGEQIALPMSALPSNFVPGDTGQIIMVESSIDDQQQEVVVESSDIAGSTTPIASVTTITTTVTTPSIMATAAAAAATTPTTTITTTSNTPVMAPSETTLISQDNLQHPQLPQQTQSPLKKQKRKEKIHTRPLNEEDIEIKFQVVEEYPPQIIVDRKPRKQYMTKKKRELAKRVTKKSNDHQIKQQPQSQQLSLSPSQSPSQTRLPSPPQPPSNPQPKLEPELETEPEPQPKPQLQSQQLPERRTRISNICRVATGKSYKCQDCDFSTDRINNIIFHVKESCPKLKKTRHK